ANKSYSYTMSVVNPGGESNLSGAAVCRTLACYPSSESVTDKTASSFVLHLMPGANIGDNEKYRITVKKSSDNSVVRAFSWSSDLDYSITGLDSTTLYDVYVDTCNSDDVARGAVKVLTLYCNRPVSASVANDADVLRSNSAGHNSDFSISLKVWDPDGDDVTVSATIAGLLRTATVKAPAAEPSSANVTLSWDIYSIPEGSYSGIVVSVTDGNDSSISATYTKTLAVDKTAPVIALTGSSSVYAEVGDSYTDDGATVTGDDGNGVIVTGAADTTKTGTYTITYSSEDDAGNKASPVSRTVKVVEPVSS
ncbi:MAG: DUF5011 domain-containing protein, partial [Oscillospiraceae bacterium]